MYVSACARILTRFCVCTQGAVCLAHAFGTKPPAAHPMAAWQKGDIICLAIDVPLRTFAIRVVRNGGTGGQWAHFAFPPSKHFTDGAVTPAITLQVSFACTRAHMRLRWSPLFTNSTHEYACARVHKYTQPGVEVEVLTELRDFQVNLAPGPGYRPVVVSRFGGDIDVNFDSSCAGHGKGAIYAGESAEIWGLDQAARNQHTRLAEGLRDKAEELLRARSLLAGVSAQELDQVCSAPGLTMEETVARAAIDVRSMRPSNLGPFLAGRVASHVGRLASMTEQQVYAELQPLVDEWLKGVGEVAKPEVRERVREEQEAKAKTAAENAKRERKEAEKEAEEYHESERKRIEFEEAAEAEAERNRPPPTIQQRRVNEGGQTGFLTITLAWDTQCDLDLHCKLPHRLGEIYHGNRRTGGGELDVDANVNESDLMTHPVENIFFASKPATGDYVVTVNNYTSRNSGKKTKYQLAVEINNAVHEFHGWVSPSGAEKKVEAVKITIPPGNKAVPVVTKVKASDGF